MQRIIQNIHRIKVEGLTPKHLRIATILRLPFHLCTGPIYHIADPENSQVNIWFRNKVSIPHNIEIYKQWAFIQDYQKRKTFMIDFFTEVSIINHKPKILPDEFETIKSGKNGAIGTASLNNPGFRLLNETISAHQMVRLGPYIPDVGALWPRMLTEREMFKCIIIEIVILAEPNCKINRDIVLDLFNLAEKFPAQTTGQIWGWLGDYSSEQLLELEHSVQKVRKHAFYELKTKAIAAMLTGDSIVAIVLGCAALEGAHGAFMRLVTRDKFPNEHSEFNSFINGLLREQGFYSLVQLTVKVLMDKEEHPSDEDLKLCLIPIMIKMCAFVISTGGPQSGPKWRNLLKNRFLDSASLRSK
jgi:hypothetical protein